MFKIEISMIKPKNKSVKEITDKINKLLTQFTNVHSMFVVKDSKKNEKK